MNITVTAWQGKMKAGREGGRKGWQGRGGLGVTGGQSAQEHGQVRSTTDF